MRKGQPQLHTFQYEIAASAWSVASELNGGRPIDCHPPPPRNPTAAATTTTTTAQQSVCPSQAVDFPGPGGCQAWLRPPLPSYSPHAAAMPLACTEDVLNPPPLPPCAPADKKIEVDWSTCFTQVFLRTLLNFLNIAAWVLMLAGIAQCQNECNSGTTPLPFPDFFNTLANTGQNTFTASDCVKYFGLTWWSVWLQFITVVIATAFTVQFFARYKELKSIFTTTMYFFIMSTVLLFFIAEKFSNATYITVNKPGYASGWESGTTLLTVGTIVSATLNFIWIIWNSYADVPSFPGQAAPPVMDTTGIDGDATIEVPATKA
eukprot:364641-Chlamydomonas_euryale.AAC.9